VKNGMMNSRAQAIRALRGALTQQQFAAEVGVTRAVISTWENGGDVSLDNANRLVELGLDVAYVLPAATAATEARADLSDERGAA
jgi:transcriptional regulator with XRE-family HTH domain